MKKTSQHENNDENADCSSAAAENDSNGSFGADDDMNDSSDLQQKTNKTASPSSGSGGGAADDAPEQIAKNETSTVKNLKLLVLAVLLLAMVTITVGVYMFTTMEEEQNFEDSLNDYTVKIFASLGENMDLTLGAVDAFVVTIVSHATATNKTWPFVTIPDFAVRAAKIRSWSSAVVLILYQLVSHEQRAEWEAYSAVHGPTWVNESIAVQERDPNYNGPIIWDYENWNVIHRNDEYDKEFPGVNGTDEDGPYLATWQNVPVIPRYPVYNWDLYGDPDQYFIEHIFNTSQVIISKPYLIYVPGDDVLNEHNEIEADWYKDYIQPGEEAMEPVIDIYYPVLANGADDVSVNVHDGNDPDAPPVNNSSNIVALLSLSFYWRDTLKNILPTGANGLDVVFENPCSPTFTYRINGPTVAYRGSGDLHEIAYSHLGTSAKLLDLMHNANEGSGGRSYTGIPVSQEYNCPSTFIVYPSAALQESYSTSTPLLFTIAAVLIFIFTSAVFVLYDIMVERRQKLVLSTATNSSAIVASLFPSKVRAALMKEQEEKERAALVEPPTKHKLTTFLTGDHDENVAGQGSAVASGTLYASKPLAELYPDTTVFFGDIAGFTAWSSTRDPCQVFTLLETLYGAFDAVARRRGVFKVETIGDSYVAVCGLPEPRKNHAVVMAKFAAECRSKTNQLCQELEVLLGSGTADLKFRIGLHSGPVTAGVLRGDKSRFQLFGDTVNTAARMESNSIKNRIQVSQKTADLLMAAGKGHWLTARDTLVEAKGKGKMQTYWLEPQMSSAQSEGDATVEMCMSCLDDDEAVEENDATPDDDVHQQEMERHHHDALSGSIFVTV